MYLIVAHKKKEGIWHGIEKQVGEFFRGEKENYH